jgi:hypothetical protein
MNNKYIKLIFIIVILSENISTNGLDVINESDPLKELFLKIFIEKDYSTLVRPTLNATSRLTRVETELKLLQIDLDEKYQELISTAWIEMIWFDNRLTWNPDEYDGITEITVNVDKIWVHILNK